MEKKALNMKVKNLFWPQILMKMSPNERATLKTPHRVEVYPVIKMAEFLNLNKKQWRNLNNKFQYNGYKNGQKLN